MTKKEGSCENSLFNHWSYGPHFLIAYYTRNYRGEGAVVITRSKYSVTTAAQVKIVFNACNHPNQLIVPKRVYLRFDEDTGRVQTSQRVGIPAIVVREFYKYDLLI